MSSACARATRKLWESTGRARPEEAAPRNVLDRSRCFDRRRTAQHFRKLHLKLVTVVCYDSIRTRAKQKVGGYIT